MVEILLCHSGPILSNRSHVPNNQCYKKKREARPEADLGFR